MPTFITRGRYSADSIRKMVAKPEDRHQSVAKLVESTGGKLLNYYVTLGQYDFLTIIEAASAKEASAFILAAAASGAVSDVETTEAFTGAEAKQVFETAAKSVSVYKPPGQ